MLATLWGSGSRGRFWTVDEAMQIVYFLKLKCNIGESDADVRMIFYVAVPFFTMDMQQLQMTEYVELK